MTGGKNVRRMPGTPDAAGAAASFALTFVAVRVADWLSLVRIPLGAAFVLVADQPRVALAVLFVAGASDVLDGWVARHSRAHAPGEPHRGDWLDPLCDKLFAASVVIGLLLHADPSPLVLVLLLLREFLQLVAVTSMRLVPALHRVSRDFDFRAHPIGKATTVAQFASCAALTLDHPAALPLAVATATLGAVSVGIYVQRIRALLNASAG